ncbi:MAG: hypothetical protein DI551_04380 [Micavibrio aeruginosavorus]|uniref:Phosphotyrosine protein phosphatase I domain-containing protein n=1 Tax=Micavibrio aeruginosavorus TaxID=349221 RepID=A0A2W5MZT8_9BACT|nr:MAG: hypothetical protein DI551_04380 [Micavibrio aeruginosavorus]
MGEKTRPHILFVCTGNIFRSLSAELAVRAASLRSGLHYRFSSAGTDGGAPRLIDPFVRETLANLGLDSSLHAPRLLTRDMLEASDLAVAMHIEHQDFIRRGFGLNVPLFREVAGREPFVLPDVDEAVPDFETNSKARNAYIADVVRSIAADSNAFLARIPAYLSNTDKLPL